MLRPMAFHHLYLEGGDGIQSHQGWQGIEKSRQQIPNKLQGRAAIHMSLHRLQNELREQM